MPFLIEYTLIEWGMEEYEKELAPIKKQAIADTIKKIRGN